jgi:hypothetical protein
MITFNGNQIKCGNVHTYLDIQGGDLHVQRTYFWGLRGTSEIVADPGVWQVSSTCWLNDASFEGAAGLQAFRGYLKTLADLRGEHGQLTETDANGNVMADYAAATFEGFNPASFDGHRAVGPIQDSVGMVSSGNGWIMQGTLMFTILVYE